MTWSPVTLSAPLSSAEGLTADVDVFTVSPWTHGIKEGAGLHSYLSFPNAVAAVLDKISGSTDAVFIVAITAANELELATLAFVLNSAFPLKQIASWQKQAYSLADLENDKFILIDKDQTNNRLAMNAVPAIKSVQKANLSQSAKSAASAYSASDPLVNLTSFQTAKTAFDAGVDASLVDATAGLIGGGGWSFYADSYVRDKLATGHPGSEYTLTAMVVFVAPAADLLLLKEIF